MAAPHADVLIERLPNKEVVLVSRPKGWVTEANFAVKESEFVFTLLHNQNLAVLSLNEAPTSCFNWVQPLWVYTLSKVMASDHPDFQEGDIAYGITHAANYAVVSGGPGLKNIDRNRAQIPLTHYLGALGIVGHTSWVGLNIITQLKPNEEVFVSAAAGAVGLLAGQLAKLKGCRVVGSVGSDEKVQEACQDAIHENFVLYEPANSIEGVHHDKVDPRGEVCMMIFLDLMMRLLMRIRRMATPHADVLIERLPNKEVVLVSRPKGWVTEANFAVKESEFVFTRPPLPGSQDVIVKVLWLSVDPYLRELVNEDSGIAGIPVFEIGKPLWVYSLSKVMASDHPDFQEGDIAYGATHVANYAVVSGGQGLKKIDRNRAQIPLTHYLGVLGIVGLTSWVGLNIITQLKPNEEVFVSAAAGAVGLLAGQLAKLKGCRVVGSVGSDEKVTMLKEMYNFDDVFNYKKEKDFNLALKRCFPNGFDVYFENVGGQMLEAVLENIKPKGRIVACGMISQYNKESNDRDGIQNLFHVTGKSLKMEGFVVPDYHYSWNTFHEEVIPLLQQGKICYKSDVLGRGIEEFAKAFIRLFKGENIGKAMVFVSEE